MSLRDQWDLIAGTTAPDARGAAIVYHGARIGLALAVAVATYILFPAAPAVDIPMYEVGSVATDNVIAPFEYTVPKPAAQLTRERDDMARTAEPVLAFVPAALDSADRQIAGFFEVVNRAALAAQGRQAAQDSIQRAAEAFGVRLNAAEAGYLAAEARRTAMAGAVDRVFDRWVASGVATSGALDGVRGNVVIRQGNDARRTPADSVASFGGLVTRSRLIHPDPGSTVGDALYIKLITSFFHPTLVPDVVATERAREELRATVPAFKYEVRAGEKIIGAHEVVGREEYEKLRALHDQAQQRTGAQRQLGRIAGAILFNLLILSIAGIALLLFRPQLYGSFRALSLFALVYLVVLVVSALVAHSEFSRPELVPIALAAIIFSALFDARISMIAAMILAVLIGGQSVFRGTNALFLSLVAGAAAAFSVRVLRRRDQSWHSILTITVAYTLAAFAIGLTLGWPIQEIGLSILLGGANAVISVALALQFALPLAEKFTQIETDVTLVDWSDLNRPLMRRLSLEAPGTYAHTMAMANLAESACNAIGANGLLARVGAYYHDIGKLKKPQYFVENQPKGRNPHDKLKPATSAAIIRNHVKEGVELAEEAQVPRVVRAFITEHHGTGQITYFLEKAKERDGPVANPGEFQYPGPLPQSAETAVVMLADGVEAAARVLQDPTPQKVRDVIDHIVRMRMEQGQLRDAPLTLKQLDVVKEQFARVLIGMYHNRIDYPASSGGITAEFASV